MNSGLTPVKCPFSGVTTLFLAHGPSFTRADLLASQHVLARYDRVTIHHKFIGVLFGFLKPSVFKVSEKKKKQLLSTSVVPAMKSRVPKNPSFSKSATCATSTLLGLPWLIHSKKMANGGGVSDTKKSLKIGRKDRKEANLTYLFDVQFEVLLTSWELRYFLFEGSKEDRI